MPSAPEKAVWLRLKSSTGVGAIAGDRIAPLQADPSWLSDGLDFVRYQRISAVFHVTHSTGGPRYQRARVQVDSFSPSYDTASDLSAEVRKRLAGYRGSTGDVQVWSMTLANERDDFEGTGGDDRLYKVSQDYMIESRVST